jgi:hypothetical protein
MKTNLAVKRVLISMGIGLLIGLALSEITFIFLGETARKPKTIEVVIPSGTAELVRHGEQPPSLSKNMMFVVGDVLVVKNNDNVDHQLGPLWIPAGTTGQLVLGQTESLSYECSFQPGNYVGFDVRESLTLATRFYGIFYAGIPLGVLLALYSFVMPDKKIIGK